MASGSSVSGAVSRWTALPRRRGRPCLNPPRSPFLVASGYGHGWLARWPSSYLNPLEELLFWERRQQLDAMWQEWLKAPLSLREKVLKRAKLDPTEHILWMGLKRRLIKFIT